MAYTAVWWRIPEEDLTGQYISMVSIISADTILCRLVEQNSSIAQTYT